MLVRVGDLVHGTDVDPALVGERADAGVRRSGDRGHVELEAAHKHKHVTRARSTTKVRKKKGHEVGGTLSRKYADLTRSTHASILVA